MIGNSVEQLIDSCQNTKSQIRDIVGRILTSPDISAGERDKFSLLVQPQIDQIFSALDHIVLLRESLDKLSALDIGVLITSSGSDNLLKILEILLGVLSTQQTDMVQVGKDIQALSDGWWFDRGGKTSSFSEVLNKAITLGTRKYIDDSNESVSYSINALHEKIQETEKNLQQSRDLIRAVTAKVDGDRFRVESRKNLLGVASFLVLITGLLCFEYHKVVLPLEKIDSMIADMDDNQFYFVLTKMAFFGLFSMAIFAALLKGLSVFLHHFLINREKSSALYTYDKFFKEGNNPIATPAATIELIKTVLGARNTGLAKEVPSDSFPPQQYVDLLREFAGSKK